MPGASFRYSLYVSTTFVSSVDPAFGAPAPKPHRGIYYRERLHTLLPGPDRLAQN
jgi:hypothetical protein